MADETPTFPGTTPVAPIAPPVEPFKTPAKPLIPVKATSKEVVGGKPPEKEQAPKIVDGKAVYGAVGSSNPFEVKEEEKQVDNSPKFKMLTNAGEFVKDQIVTAKEVKDKYPNADDWVKRGILRKYTPPTDD